MEGGRPMRRPEDDAWAKGVGDGEWVESEYILAAKPKGLVDLKNEGKKKIDSGLFCFRYWFEWVSFTQMGKTQGVTGVEEQELGGKISIRAT